MTPELDLRPAASALPAFLRSALARPRSYIAGPRVISRPPAGTTVSSWLVLTGAVRPADQWWPRPPTPEETLAAPAVASRSAASGAPFSKRAWGALLLVLGYR